ncbi:hypothetical protein FRC05_006329 [Tulasnella sp. 425]|nr:hypothetical protein FRC05_006329 [Tulasnella sp. 425]
MAQQRTPGKAWSTSEDEKLIDAVQKYGENTESWKTIAEAVPGRTNKACRKRWKHSLHPSIKKTPWEPEEDELLLQLYAQHPGRWAMIANHIPGRTDDACAKRYREALDPNLKKDDWTKEEDERLLEGFARHGASWGKIGEELGRSGLGCRNRWRLLERRKNAAERRKAKPTSTESGKPRKVKRKREPSEEDTTDGELSDDDEPRPGPSRRRLSAPGDRMQPLPSMSNTSESTPVDSGSPDPLCPPLTATEASPILTGGPVIDPAIIGMALGKCPCGCASGTSPCNCSSTNPALNLTPNPQFIDSLDWNQLYPYLQAELPTVFVDPPPIHAAASSNPPALLNMYQGASVLQDFVRQQGRKCGCSSSGCCSSEQTKSACCSSQQVPSSCCQPSAPAPSLSNGSMAQSNRLLHESDAEAAKMVLDYATFFVQKQQGTSAANALLQQTPTMTSHSPNQHPSPPASCQTPASHLLIGIIEKYQQQKSTPSSNATSGILSNVPLPIGSAGCGCGCGDANVNSTKGTPQPFFSTVSEAQAISLQNAVGIPSTTTQAVEPGHDELAPSGSCCGGKKEANDMATHSLEQQQPPTNSISSAIATYFPSTESAPIPTLPSYVPGCTCGCASGTPADSCTCGCVGICLCGFQGGDFTSLELAPSSTESDANALLALSTPSQVVVQQTGGGSCCGGGSKSHGTEGPDPSLAMDAPSANAISLETSLELPSFIPGFQSMGTAERTVSHSRNPSLELHVVRHQPQQLLPAHLNCPITLPTIASPPNFRRLYRPTPVDIQIAGDLPSLLNQACMIVPVLHSAQSINGMQYHLQLSKVHFAGPPRGSDSLEDHGDKGKTESTQDDVPRATTAVKAFKCPREGCSSAYKQAAGLKYHLAHGHPAVQPVQFGAF